MEELWADPSRDESQFESPKWHGGVLRERVEAGKSVMETFIDWEEVKMAFRKKSAKRSWHFKS